MKGSLVFLVVETVMDPSTYTQQEPKEKSQHNNLTTRWQSGKKGLITYQIKLARDPVLLQCALNDRPRLLQVLLCTQTSKILLITLR
jgi:hypothetical protein